MCRVLLSINKQKKSARKVAEMMMPYLKQRGVRVAHFRYDPLGHNPALHTWVPRVDFAICIGGDGTALHLCRALNKWEIPIVTINCGQLGFITEFSADNWQDVIDAMLRKEYEVEKRMLLDVCVFEDEKTKIQMNALNEAVISVAGISRLTHYSVHVGDQFLASYRADGIIVATPTGSTAYSVAAGGPILHPELTTLIINPICPFTLAHRPLVIPATEDIRIIPHEIQGMQTVLTIDGQQTYILTNMQKVRIQASKNKAFIVRSDTYSFYETIRRKLKWAVATHAE